MDIINDSPGWMDGCAEFCPRVKGRVCGREEGMWRGRMKEGDDEVRCGRSSRLVSSLV